MTTQEYLDAVLQNQTLAPDGKEMKELQEERNKVQALLEKEFKDSDPTIRYGGSKAKSTMILESYDLDIVCYFPFDDKMAEDSLKEIFNKTKKALASKYTVQPKTSALRLLNTEKMDFHIDVVPGKFTDDKKGDAYLHVNGGDKDRLKTNLQKHIDHIKDSGREEAIRLMKLWKIRNGLSIKTFALELLVIDILKGSKTSDLSKLLMRVWEQMRDHSDELVVTDPANPEGNDLSGLLDSNVKAELKRAATNTINTVENKGKGWEKVFGPTKEASKEEKAEAIARVAASIPTPAKSWCPAHEPMA